MISYEITIGIILGFFMCILLFEAIRKGYFQWVGKSRPSHAIIKDVVKECGNMCVTTQQDRSDFFALIHSSYAKAYCDILHKISDEKFIYESSGIKLHDLQNDVNLLHENRIQNFIKRNPEIAPPQTPFTSLSDYGTSVPYTQLT